jgi:hypothetical protein
MDWNEIPNFGICFSTDGIIFSRKRLMTPTACIIISSCISVRSEIYTAVKTRFQDHSYHPIASIWSTNSWENSSGHTRAMAKNNLGHEWCSGSEQCSLTWVFYETKIVIHVRYEEYYLLWSDAVSPVKVHLRFGETSCLRLHGPRVNQAKQKKQQDVIRK